MPRIQYRQMREAGVHFFPRYLYHSPCSIYIVPWNECTPFTLVTCERDRIGRRIIPEYNWDLHISGVLFFAENATRVSERFKAARSCKWRHVANFYLETLTRDLKQERRLSSCFFRSNDSSQGRQGDSSYSKLVIDAPSAARQRVSINFNLHKQFWTKQQNTYCYITRRSSSRGTFFSRWHNCVALRAIYSRFGSYVICKISRDDCASIFSWCSK